MLFEDYLKAGAKISNGTTTNATNDTFKVPLPQNSQKDQEWSKADDNRACTATELKERMQSKMEGFLCE